MALFQIVFGELLLWNSGDKRSLILLGEKNRNSLQTHLVKKGEFSLKISHRCQEDTRRRENRTHMQMKRGPGKTSAPWTATHCFLPSVSHGQAIRLALVPSFHIAPNPYRMLSPDPPMAGPFIWVAFQLTCSLFQRSSLAIPFTYHDHRLSYSLWLLITLCLPH